MMSIDPRILAAALQNSEETLTVDQVESLQNAVAKIVALGAQRGVTPEQMIDLLKSGLTVGELLEYVSRGGEVA